MLNKISKMVEHRNNVKLWERWVNEACDGDLVLLQQVLRQERARIEHLRDPFAEIIDHDPAAREQEYILFENNDLLVLSDPFSSTPKALVVAKTSVIFPNEVPIKLLRHMTEIADKTGAALAAASPSKVSISQWIDPPQRLNVRRLHIHVAIETNETASEWTYQKAARLLIDA